MKVEAIEERKARRRAELKTIKNTRYKVVCVVLYEPDLDHDDAALEAASARHACDCGGFHAVLPMAKFDLELD